MKPEKAIQDLKSYADASWGTLNNSFKAAIAALEKQVPKKPKEERQYFGNGKCPCCGAVFMDKLTNYCGNCGQALDWTFQETKTENSSDSSKTRK